MRGAKAKRDQVSGQNPQPQRRQEEPRLDNVTVSGRSKNPSISSPQPPALAGCKLMSAKLLIDHTLAICGQSPYEKGMEVEHPLKIIKLRESGRNMRNQELFLTDLVTMGYRIDKGKIYGTD